MNAEVDDQYGDEAPESTTWGDVVLAGAITAAILGGDFLMRLGGRLHFWGFRQLRSRVDSRFRDGQRQRER